MEDSIFLDVVGDSTRMRVLQYLIEGRHFSYTLTDLANNAGVSWGTLHSIFPVLLKFGLVIKEREVGRAKLYKLNLENPIAKKFVDLYDFILTNSLEKSVLVEVTS